MKQLNMENYIDGEWTGKDLEKIEVTNPATGDVVGTVPQGTKADAEKAVSAAHKALNDWRNKPAAERAELLMKLNDLMLENVDELADLMTLENGKPRKESVGEVKYAASFIQWFAEEGKRVYGRIVPGKSESHRIQVLKQPVGVVAAITPWNFPAAMITRKMAPALAAGCTFIVKPPEQTPLTALKIAEYAEKAGIPKGVFNVVNGDAKELSKVFMDHKEVRKITFTGSTEVGKILIKQSAEQVKKTSMELGGQAPAIVCDDADLDHAVEQIVASKFRNSGQTCVCVNRIYAHQKIYDKFVEKLAAEVSKIKVGNGMEDGVDVGPLINKEGYEKVDRQVKDAINKGAVCLTGGEGKAENNTYFYQPTVLKDANHDMEIMNIETFGPIAPVQKFETDEEAVKLANDTPFGLASYFFTKDISRGTRIAESLDYGIVGWNDGLPSAAQAPFGGMKQSGLGREGGAEGIEDYLETKYISLTI